MELPNSIKQFIARNEYNCTITRTGNRERISIGEIVHEYVNPIKQDIIFKIDLLDSLIDNINNKRESKEISNTLLLHYNYEIQRLEAVRIALNEILITL